MNKTIITTIGLAAVAFAWPLMSNAQVYKSVDKNGVVSYSDRPQPGSSKVKLNPLPSYHAPKPLTTKSTSTPAKNNANKVTGSSYSAFGIVSPRAQETLRNNQGLVPVRMAVQPALQADIGDRVVVFLDGKQVSQPSTSTSVALHGVFRGSHRLEAKIINAKGKVVASSQSVTFHMQRPRVNNNNNNAGNSPIAPPPTIQPIS